MLQGQAEALDLEGVSSGVTKSVYAGVQLQGDWE